ncbi:response regulator transcription factor [Bacillus aquiflavi]|uniref:response regulator transcription factor n=1 Tax=Bacillus aquiflavi TaxID=2672567 RepID=UPI0035A936F7
MDKIVSKISQKELKIIEMIADEMPNKLIASELNYSQRMIEYYINSLTKKLNVQTRVGIVSKAYKMKLLN